MVEFDLCFLSQAIFVDDSRPVAHRVVDSFLKKFFPSGYPYRWVKLLILSGFIFYGNFFFFSFLFYFSHPGSLLVLHGNYIRFWLIFA